MNMQRILCVILVVTFLLPIAGPVVAFDWDPGDGGGGGGGSELYVNSVIGYRTLKWDIAGTESCLTITVDRVVLTYETTDSGYTFTSYIVEFTFSRTGYAALKSALFTLYWADHYIGDSWYSELLEAVPGNGDTLTYQSYGRDDDMSSWQVPRFIIWAEAENAFGEDLGDMYLEFWIDSHSVPWDMHTSINHLGTGIQDSESWSYTIT